MLVGGGPCVSPPPNFPLWPPLVSLCPSHAFHCHSKSEYKWPQTTHHFRPFCNPLSPPTTFHPQPQKKKERAVGQNNKFVQVNRVILIYEISCGFHVAFCKCHPLFEWTPPLEWASALGPAPSATPLSTCSINDTTQGFDPLIISLLRCKYSDLIDSISFHFFSPRFVA